MTQAIVAFVVYLVFAALIAELRALTDPESSDTKCALTGMAWPVLVLMVCVVAFFAGVEQIFEDRP